MKKAFVFQKSAVAVAALTIALSGPVASHADWTQIGIIGAGYDSKIMALDSVLFTSTDSGTFRSTNNGAAWTRINGIYQFLSIGRNAANFYATDYGHLYTSTNQGVTWSRIASIDQYTTSNGQTFIKGLAVQNNKIMVLGTNKAFLSENDGQTWKICNSFGGNVPGNKCCIIGNTLLAITGIGIYRSSNSGFNWIESNYGMLRSPQQLLFNGTYVWAGVQGNQEDHQCGVYISNDTGSTWNAMGLNRPVNELTYNKSILFAASDTGVYCTPVDSSAWVLLKIPLISGKSLGRVQSIAVDTGNLYALSYCADTVSGEQFFNLYRRPLSEVNASIHKLLMPSSKPISKNLIIDRNRFRNSVSITFAPGVSQIASLRVFSGSGRSVATLFEGATGNETRKCVWSHETLPSGVYYVYLQSENARAVKRVNVMR